MELPNSHHPQAIASQQSLEEMLQGCPKSIAQQQERKARPHPAEHALKCPRCASTNTKFCYYNNYSLSQPRYFCKGCRRYWTQGGSLRNVPVGGGCRKNKRSSSNSSSSSTSSSAKIKALEPNHPMATSSNNPLLLPTTLLHPPIGYEPSDLTLDFAATLQKQQPVAHQASSKQLGFEHDSTITSHLFLGHPGTDHISSAPTSGFLDILRSGFVDTRSCTSGLNGFYYGFPSANGGVEVGSGEQDQAMLSSEGGGGGGLIGAPASTVTSQGSCKDMDEAETTKVLMGFPWQVAGDHHGSGMYAVDSAGRDYWAATGAAAASSWHGLINNPLM